jgi:hypothetical protein
LTQPAPLFPFAEISIKMSTPRSVPPVPVSLRLDEFSETIQISELLARISGLGLRFDGTTISVLEPEVVAEHLTQALQYFKVLGRVVDHLQLVAQYTRALVNLSDPDNLSNNGAESNVNELFSSVTQSQPRALASLVRVVYSVTHSHGCVSGSTGKLFVLASGR